MKFFCEGSKNAVFNEIYGQKFYKYGRNFVYIYIYAVGGGARRFSFSDCVAALALAALAPASPDCVAALADVRRSTTCGVTRRIAPGLQGRTAVIFFRKPLKALNSALRSLGKMLIYFSKLRFCLSRKP
jgi:hypothetical protein